MALARRLVAPVVGAGLVMPWENEAMSDHPLWSLSVASPSIPSNFKKALWASEIVIVRIARTINEIQFFHDLMI